MAKTVVALLMGGHSTERAVSLASGQNVMAQLDPALYKVMVFDPAVDLIRLIEEAPSLNVVFPVLHGADGENGSIQGFLGLLGLPYVGSGVLASATCIDKKATKDVYRSQGLPVAPDCLLSREKPLSENLLTLEKAVGYPAVVKPLDQGSSVGLTIVKTADLAPRALSLAFETASLALGEKFLPGRELTVGVIGNDRLRALPPLEIIPAAGHDFFDYEAKYTQGQAREVVPSDFTPAETSKIQELALTAHRALGCRGLSRTDFIYSDGVFYLLETNTMPGLTENSLLPKAALAAGLSFPALLTTLIDLALGLE
ncbi:MAG: D-alanine--D-alanine ligase [Deltaproteobacteria bacterium]|nr:D-alanine--D-alanine ligase [Deltaproteobacteria bacterium]